MSLAWLIEDLMHVHQRRGPVQISRRVSRNEYESWAAGFVFEGLKNQRYGQSFCGKFGIHDYTLFYTRSVARADSYIRKHYVTRARNQ